MASVSGGSPASGQGNDKGYTVAVSEDFFNVEPDEQTKLILNELKKLRHEINDLKARWENRIIDVGESPSNLGGTGTVTNGVI